MRLKNYLEEAKVVNFLSKKIEKLKKQHGYISKSMFTKKELEQLQKSSQKIKEASDLNEIFFMAAAIGGAMAAGSKKTHGQSSEWINELIRKVVDLGPDHKKGVEIVIKQEKLDRKLANYLRKLFK